MCDSVMFAVRIFLHLIIAFPIDTSMEPNQTYNRGLNAQHRATRHSTNPHITQKVDSDNNKTIELAEFLDWSEGVIKGPAPPPAPKAPEPAPIPELPTPDTYWTLGLDRMLCRGVRAIATQLANEQKLWSERSEMDNVYFQVEEAKAEVDWERVSTSFLKGVRTPEQCHLRWRQV